MKKFICILLAMITLLSFMSVTVFAQNYTSGEYLYEEQFVKNYESYLVGTMSGGNYYYSERYYHHVDENDPESEIDWVLVNANTSMEQPWFIKLVVRDRVFVGRSEGIPFKFGVAIYDVNNKTFHEISDSTLQRFEDAERIILDERGYGRPIGDADMDDKLTVMDATYIQMVAARLKEYDSEDELYGWDYGGNLQYISDFNRDNIRDILDATAIQHKLAALDKEPTLSE